MAKSNKVVIQSFVPHRLEVNFRDKDGKVIVAGNQPKTVVVPAKQESPKNILVLSVADYDAVKADLAPYEVLGQNQGVTILDDIPSGYWDPTQRVAEAEAKRVAAEAELAGARDRMQGLEARIEELRGILVKTFGWKDDGK